MQISISGHSKVQNVHLPERPRQGEFPGRSSYGRNKVVVERPWKGAEAGPEHAQGTNLHNNRIFHWCISSLVRRLHTGMLLQQLLEV